MRRGWRRCDSGVLVKGGEGKRGFFSEGWFSLSLAGGELLGGFDTYLAGVDRGFPPPPPKNGDIWDVWIK